MTAITYNGIKGDYYKLNNEYLTFQIEGTNNNTETFYSCEVEARIFNEWVIVENVDSNGYEYDNFVKRMIREMAKPHFVSFE